MVMVMKPLSSLLRGRGRPARDFPVQYLPGASNQIPSMHYIPASVTQLATYRLPLRGPQV